ncbi:MAG: heme exporter protein CcmB [Chloroflexi bacterium]|nr:heme exporter protein CcmB [Chloroflexota bacterium]
MRALLSILWKDLLLEIRTKETVTPVLVFALLVVVIFDFALEPRRDLIVTVAPGVLWASITFAGVLGLSRTFTLEQERGGLQGLMLAPIGREVIYLGKFLSSFIFMLAVEAAILPVFSAIFNLPFFLPQVWVQAILATLGYAAVGTVFAAMSLNTRARDIMLPVLFFPIVVPVLMAAVEGTSAALRGESWSGALRWIQLTAAFDIIFTVLGAMTFGLVLKE